MSGPCWAPPIPSSGTCWDDNGICDEEPPPPIPCPECPPVDIWPNIPPWKITPNIQNAINGSLNHDQKDTIWRLKNAVLAIGGWSVSLSSTSSTMGAPGVDEWTTFSAISRPGVSGGVHSWMLLQRADGIQWLISITIDSGWTEYSMQMSPGGLFTGGAAGVPPTATDAVTDNGGPLLGSNGTADCQYTTHLWQSTDNTVTRFIIFAGASAANPIYEFAIAKPGSTDPSWTNPIVLETQAESAHNQISPNTILSKDNPAGWQGNDFMQARMSPSLVTNALAAILPTINTYAFANQLSSKYPLYPTYIQGDTSGAKGTIGKIRDVWWWGGPNGHAFTNVGVYTDGAGNYLLVINSIVLPWLPAVTPACVTLATVGPFYGMA